MTEGKAYIVFKQHKDREPEFIAACDDFHFAEGVKDATDGAELVAVPFIKEP